jgi:hypothetical protein
VATFFFTANVLTFFFTCFHFIFNPSLVQFFRAVGGSFFLSFLDERQVVSDFFVERPEPRKLEASNYSRLVVPNCICWERPVGQTSIVKIKELEGV